MFLDGAVNNYLLVADFKNLLRQLEDVTIGVPRAKTQCMIRIGEISTL